MVTPLFLVQMVTFRSTTGGECFFLLEVERLEPMEAHIIRKPLMTRDEQGMLALLINNAEQAGLGAEFGCTLDLAFRAGVHGNELPALIFPAMEVALSAMADDLTWARGLAYRTGQDVRQNPR